MIIHLTGSTRQMGEDYPFLQCIASSINQHGDVIARNWIEAARARVEQGHADEDVEWERIMHDTLQALHASDAVIIEGTGYSFMQGYQAALASAAKKPVLIVTRQSYAGHLASGLDHPLISIRKYSTEDDLKKVIGNFLDKFTKENKS